MKLLKKMSLTVSLVLWVCFNIAPVAYGWATFEQLHKSRYNILIRKVHADHWTIGYDYIDCPPEKMNNGKALEEAMTKVLQTWLQPVRDLNTGKPIVNDFRYEHKERIWGEEAVKPFDLVVSFFCRFGISSIGMGKLIPPRISMRQGTEVTPRFLSVLLHEIGHAFGLADTYTRPAPMEAVRASKGGLARTIGHQPSSTMNSYHNRVVGQSLHLSEDDKNGIIWLYKFYHENLPLEDCFFPDYELEESPMGCVPKDPLIFEIKHGIESNGIKIIRDDPELDLNAKDELGTTALHYAVLKNYRRLVKREFDK